jgi:hypothetical protein
MANEQLRQAIHDAGLEPEDLATQIEVDIKTVERWIAGRTPYPRYRTRVSRALNREQHELWPDLTKETQASDIDISEEHQDLVAVFADANDPKAPSPTELLAQATTRIDLLDLTLAHLIAGDGTVQTLANKAAAGTQIRVLVSDPESAHLTVTEAERNPAQQLGQRPTLAAAVDHTLAALKPLATNGAEIRTFVAPGYNSILRADDQMLVALHLSGTNATQTPLLHLHADAQPDLFAQFLNHYEAIWATATRSA